MSELYFIHLLNPLHYVKEWEDFLHEDVERSIRYTIKWEMQKNQQNTCYAVSYGRMKKRQKYVFIVVFIIISIMCKKQPQDESL